MKYSIILCMYSIHLPWLSKKIMNITSPLWFLMGTLKTVLIFDDWLLCTLKMGSCRGEQTTHLYNTTCKHWSAELIACGHVFRTSVYFRPWINPAATDLNTYPNFILFKFWCATAVWSIFLISPKKNIHPNPCWPGINSATNWPSTLMALVVTRKRAGEYTSRKPFKWPVPSSLIVRVCTCWCMPGKHSLHFSRVLHHLSSLITGLSVEVASKRIKSRCIWRSPTCDETTKWKWVTQHVHSPHSWF